MNKETVRIECMTEILEGVGISANENQIKEIVSGFSGHIEMEVEQCNYQHVSSKKECLECEKLKFKIKQLEVEIEAYKKSVMKITHSESVRVERGEVKIYRGR